MPDWRAAMENAPDPMEAARQVGALLSAKQAAQFEELAQLVGNAWVGTTRWHYFSTACLHDQHDDCRGTCKYCDKPCRCKHHETGG